MGAGHGDPDRPERDAGWDHEARHETPTERLDRNWADLLQELRVAQTGVQLLTGLLLTLPFQARFTQLREYQHNAYLVAVVLSVASTGFLVAPVSLHRVLFRRHARRTMVNVGHRCALAGLVLLALAVAGVVFLIFDVVAGQLPGILAAAGTLVFLGALWAVLPIGLRAGEDRR